MVTKHGRPAAVLLSIEDLESLEETLEVLSDAKLIDDIRKGHRDVKAGRIERRPVNGTARRVDWTRSALRGLDRLPEKAETACIEFVFGALAENPQRVGGELRLELAGKRSARRGDFRVIYEIDDDNHVVTVIAVDHRSSVYRRR